jgi:hypothetical protein
VLYLNPKNTQAPGVFLSISCFVLPLEGAILFIVELWFESQILDASKIVAQFHGHNFRFSAKRLKDFLANLEHCSKSTLQHFFILGFDISEECIESAMKWFSEMHYVSSQLVIKGFSVLWDI